MMKNKGKNIVKLFIAIAPAKVSKKPVAVAPVKVSKKSVGKPVGKIIDDDASDFKEKLRPLTSEEIEDILSVIKPSQYIPKAVAKSINDGIKASFRVQLEKCEVFPSIIPELKTDIYNDYYDSLANAGENIGIIMAQSIGEKQTQANLNVFHKCGSSDKQPVVSKFSELLSATARIKSPLYYIYIKDLENNKPVLDMVRMREIIGHSLAQITFKKLTLEFEIVEEKKPEPWYKIFFELYKNSANPPVSDTRDYKNCISLKIDMDVLYENRLSLKNLAEYIENEYDDLYCIFSPDCFGQLDIFVNTNEIDIPEEKLFFVTKDNMKQIYLEEIVQPNIENIIICGIAGINNIFFLKDSNTKEWYVETENARDKVNENTKFKKTKSKPLDSAKRFKKLLSLDFVDKERTISNNIWDIYHTFGIEAVRQYMIDQFTEIMEGINLCHVMLLVDRMTFEGAISPISRYTMKQEVNSVCQRSSFEESTLNFLEAGFYGQDEPVKGVSANIICGKKAYIGTGMCDLMVDVNKLISLKDIREDGDEKSDSSSDESEESDSSSDDDE